MREIPALVELQGTYGADDFQVIGVTGTDAATAGRLAQKYGINYPLYVEAGGTLRDFGIRFVPEVFLVDPDGVIRADGLGAARRVLARERG